VIPGAPDVAPFGFSPDEQERYDQFVPAIPNEVVAQLLREYRCDTQKEDLLQEAYIGAARGVRTFDESKGASLRTWVFFSALHAAQSLLRGEKRQSRIVQAMWSAAMERCKHMNRSFETWTDTPEMNRTALTEHRSEIDAAAYVGIAIAEPASGGIDEIVHRETARQCAAGLTQILGDLPARRLQLLQLRFGNDLSVKEAAVLRGEKGYRAELVEFHRVVDLVSARMHGLKFEGLPPFPQELRGTLLAEVDEP
jgi:RNA polymerase sigma factor (sigma-70 family)